MQQLLFTRFTCLRLDRKWGLAILFVMLCGVAQAQNMMTALSEPDEIAWYNQHFAGLEDSVTHYQEAIKKPQIPMERSANLAAYQKELGAYRAAMRQFVVAHRKEDTAAKALLISCFREIEINQDTLNALAGLLEGPGADNAYSTYLSQELKGRANNEVGKPFIDFSLPDDKGVNISSSNYRGKYLLVLFWASWCGPCRAEMPSFISVYQQFTPGPLEVVAVSVDTDKNAWLHAKKQDGTTWFNVFDAKAWNSPVVRDYAIHRIPQNILVGPDGHIAAKNISAAGLQKLLGKAVASHP
ncbi:Peroxiredoxin [Arachidicoccus rhizosphaerae]|uniref:Peroxiredoxin n=1 Tax=Arachidicoccus rhizosphaerae TaxID=551991 RepID=A0A1H3W8T4_9BACT|nr:TlpA disulfide reductase family protein [Arachidicoccus rhizosphaerae]SDZ83513.1 Peroxiredoxin [Arachidicoccus rhizosphaerae]